MAVVEVGGRDTRDGDLTAAMLMEFTVIGTFMGLCAVYHR